MVKPQVIEGVTHLLSVTEGTQDIIPNTIKACTYLTMNFDFASHPSSYDMLKCMIPLIG